MENMSFETMLKELEGIVSELEKKEIALDVAVKQYQKGLELAKACYTMLEEAKQVIVKEAE